uniref:Uncharacterized protein n=1 Tax=Arundo donax TaxID=35708 RepID=A0A0A9C8B3_ARUDO
MDESWRRTRLIDSCLSPINPGLTLYSQPIRRVGLQFY